jgi:hypothetical protein
MSLVHAVQSCRKLTCVIAPQLFDCSADQYAVSLCSMQVVFDKVYIYYSLDRLYRRRLPTKTLVLAGVAAFSAAAVPATVYSLLKGRDDTKVTRSSLHKHIGSISLECDMLIHSANVAVTC